MCIRKNLTFFNTGTKTTTTCSGYSCGNGGKWKTACGSNEKDSGAPCSFGCRCCEPGE